MRYTVVIAGRRAGSATVAAAKTSVHVEYEFNDRGRGPKIQADVALEEDGIRPRTFAIRGHNYFKIPVSEDASIEAGHARWKSSGEVGERSLPAPALYVPLEGAPPLDGLNARALLRAADHRIALLPAGEAQIEKLLDREVAGNRSEKKKIALYFVSGLDFAAAPIWLDQDEVLFFEGDNWGGVIRSGYEDALQSLVDAQSDARAERFGALAKKLTHRPKGLLAIIHARVFDSERKKVTPNTTVVVNGTDIVSVGADKKSKLPEGAEVIDAAGKMLLPGLFDMHTHVFETDGLLDIAAGVTTVRDMANDIDKVADLRRRWSDGSAIGPRVLLAGIIDGPGPTAGPTKVLAATEDEARAAVERYATLGYAQIKIYNSVDPKLVPVIVASAHQHQMRVSGHVPAFMRAEDAVNAGFDEIQHLNFLFLNFLREVKDTRGPVRFTAVAENAASLDLDSAEVKAFIDLLKTRQVVIDPTLAIFENMLCARTGHVSPGYAAVADRLPVQVARGLLAGGLPVPEGKDQRYKDSFAKMSRMVKALFDAGVRIVAGTDATAGFAYQRELELYSEAGIPNADVLALATFGAAKVMKQEKDLGSIAKGKKADLVLIDGDPLARMSDIRKVRLVIKDGVLFRPEELDRAIGVKP